MSFFVVVLIISILPPDPDASGRVHPAGRREPIQRGEGQRSTEQTRETHEGIR